MSDCSSCESTSPLSQQCPQETGQLSFLEGRDSQCRSRILTPSACSIVTSSASGFEVSDGSKEEPLCLDLQAATSGTSIVLQNGKVVVTVNAPEDDDYIFISRGGRWVIAKKEEITPCFEPSQLSSAGVGSNLVAFSCGEDGRMCISKFDKPNCNLATNENGEVICAEKVGFCFDSTALVEDGESIAVGKLQADGKMCLKFIPVPSGKCKGVVLEEGKISLVDRPKIEFRKTGNDFNPLNVGNVNLSANSALHTDVVLTANLTPGIDTSKCFPSYAILSVSITFRQLSTSSRGTYTVKANELVIARGEVRPYNSSTEDRKDIMIQVPVAPDGTVKFKYTLSQPSKNFSLDVLLVGLSY